MFEIGHHSHNHVSHARWVIKRDHQDSINGRSVKGMRIYTCKIEGRVGKSRSGSSMQNYGSTPDKIKFIDGSRETLKLAVRITDLWFVGTPNKSEQAEMVIVDSNGDEIHVVCKPDRLKSWKADLKENCTYVMHNFKVMKNDGQFRVYEHQYKLVFTGVSVVRQSNLDHLPFKEFKFVEFSNVIASDFEAGLLVGKLSCNLSTHFGHHFLAYLNETENDGPMVIILTHARIKEGQGKSDVIFASCGAH
ncbi:hypothetical protein JHK87_039623 [Glycine soja]|nr:hypothetical protein JHK87_039623 [Glycine soja]